MARHARAHVGACEGLARRRGAWLAARRAHGHPPIGDAAALSPRPERRSASSMKCPLWRRQACVCTDARDTVSVDRAKAHTSTGVRRILSLARRDPIRPQPRQTPARCGARCNGIGASEHGSSKRSRIRLDFQTTETDTTGTTGRPPRARALCGGHPDPPGPLLTRMQRWLAPPRRSP